MVISSFISSILILALGVWAYIKLESTMNLVAEKQLLIEPSRFSYKMWKDMPVTMYQSFTFFNLTNWQQVKSVGQKPRFVEVGPYVYRTIWTKSDINFLDEERLVNFAERKQWIFQPSLSKGSEEDQIWTINTPLMTALALIQNAPVITRNIVSVILDGLGEGAFIKRNIKSLLFDGYSDLIVSVGPLFDRRFANFNGKFAYLYNKNDSIDGHWTVSTGLDDITQLNKITRFQSAIVNMTSQASGQMAQGLNEVKADCAAAWSLDSATNGQLFTPFNKDLELVKMQQQLVQLRQQRTVTPAPSPTSPSSSTPTVKRFFSRSTLSSSQDNHNHHQQDLVPNPFLNQKSFEQSGIAQALQQHQTVNSAGKPAPEGKPQLKDVGKFIFYPDLCRPIHLLPSKLPVATSNGIQASRYYIDPRVFMNSSQVPANKCFEMNPKPALANALAATISSVTGANVAMPNLVVGGSSPFAIFANQASAGHHPGSPHHNHAHHGEGLFERTNNPASFLNNALHSLGASVGSNQQDQLAGSPSNNNPATTGPIGRLGRVRQLFSNIVSQRMSGANPTSLLPSLAASPAGMLIGAGSHHNHLTLNPFSLSNARNSLDEQLPASQPGRQPSSLEPGALQTGGSQPAPVQLAPQIGNPPTASQSGSPQVSPGGSDRWVTQFRFKWPKGVFSIGQCQLGAPIYASLPHFLDADEYYLDQVDGLKPNRSLHEFYIDIESTLHSIPVNAKARLQLNVATPELRFRNIPNAMIPVLWQEVTFTIDKPIATMLYWSFTMSGTIYRSISVLLLLLGSLLFVVSFVGGLRRHMGRKVEAVEEAEVDRDPSDEGSLNGRQPAATATSSLGNGDEIREGQSSSWRRSYGTTLGDQHLASAQADTSLDDHQMGALNRAFSASSCSEFIHNINCLTNITGEHQLSPAQSLGISQGVLVQAAGSGQLSSISTTTSSVSPKQPSSRASSHCELVGSNTSNQNNNGPLNCAGCLLACLRHSCSAHNHQLISSISDNTSLVRRQLQLTRQQQQQHSTNNSNTDQSDSSVNHHKANNLLSAANNCSIYESKTRTFK